MPPTAVPMMQPESESMDAAAAMSVAVRSVVRSAVRIVVWIVWGLVIDWYPVSRWLFYISMRLRQGGIWR